MAPIGYEVVKGVKQWFFGSCCLTPKRYWRNTRSVLFERVPRSYRTGGDREYTGSSANLTVTGYEDTLALVGDLLETSSTLVSDLDRLDFAMGFFGVLSCFSMPGAAVLVSV